LGQSLAKIRFSEVFPVEDGLRLELSEKPVSFPGWLDTVKIPTWSSLEVETLAIGLEVEIGSVQLWLVELLLAEFLAQSDELVLLPGVLNFVRLEPQPVPHKFKDDWVHESFRVDPLDSFGTPKAFQNEEERFMCPAHALVLSVRVGVLARALLTRVSVPID